MVVGKMSLQLVLSFPSKDDMLILRGCGGLFILFALYAAFSNSEFAIKALAVLAFSAIALFLLFPAQKEVILDKTNGRMQVTESSLFTKRKKEYGLKEIREIRAREISPLRDIITEVEFLLQDGRTVGSFRVSARNVLISQINIRTENPSAEQLSEFLGVPVKMDQEAED